MDLYRRRLHQASPIARVTDASATRLSSGLVTSILGRYDCTQLEGSILLGRERSVCRS
jgi:hypothetical protein